MIIENYQYKYNIGEVLAKEKTPFYLYFKEDIVNNYKNYSKYLGDIDHKICYAMKANHNLSILKLLASLNSGIDAVSINEILKAIKAGINKDKIVFAGVGKTREEIELAIKLNIGEFTIESYQELLFIAQIAKKLQKKVKISLRVNPDIDAKTIDKISTGRKGDKFGIDIDKAANIYEEINNDNKFANLEIYGIAIHIGSQITSIDPFLKSFQKVKELFYILKNKNINITNIDLGGGIGIDYNDEKLIDMKEYCDHICKLAKELNISITLAPGRSIIAKSALLFSKIIYLKNSGNKNFIIIDAAMNDFPRPALYDSYHKSYLIQNNQIVNIGGNANKYDIVGPICETTDIMAKDRYFNNPKIDDLIMFSDTGAYCSSMSNEYNLRPLIKEIMIDKNNNYQIIRRKASFEDMISLEI